MKRIAMGAFALAMALGFAGAAESQVICSKTNNKGKTKFKLRDVCKSNEVVSQDFVGFTPGDVVTTADLPAPPGDLATTADVAAVPRTRVYGFDAGVGVTTVTSAGAAVMLNGAETSVDITTTSGSTDLVITFHAECSLPAANGSWVELDIKVDGVAYGSTAQAAQDDAFCSDTLWATNSATVVAPNLPAGVHTVTIDAVTIGQEAFLDDAGLTILAVED